MKYIYIVILISFGSQVPCPYGLKVCNTLHVGNDTTRYYYCDRENAVTHFKKSRNYETWVCAANGKYPVYYLSRKVDSIPMTKENIDSLNKEYLKAKK